MNFDTKKMHFKIIFITISAGQVNIFNKPAILNCDDLQINLSCCFKWPAIEF